MKIFELIAALSLIALSTGGSILEIGGKVRYDDYKVFKITFGSQMQKQKLLTLAATNRSYQVWHEKDLECNLMVAPKAMRQFEDRLTEVNASAELFIENVQHLIDQEWPQHFSSGSKVDWTHYNRLPEIEAWLDEVVAANPNVCESFSIGKSFEDRDIRGIKISYKKGNPGVFIESNIHAREWITSATATWLINELLTSKDELVRDLAENIDWYIIPVLNVDGFVYSHEKDRLWRKTRQPSVNSNCIGADPNRNYDSHWMENGGASSDPCDETYAGPYAFSEPETKAMADFVASIKDKVNVMLAFHSYSQLLLAPYGHTKDEFPENYDDLMQVARAYSEAVKQLPYGTVFEYGSSADILYLASGATNDWAYNEQDVKISYTIEFRDTGNFGFVLPPAFIKANAEETLIGIMALLAESKKLGYLVPKYKI